VAVVPWAVKDDIAIVIDRGSHVRMATIPNTWSVHCKPTLSFAILSEKTCRVVRGLARS
jgi:hypothetical protein